MKNPPRSQRGRLKRSTSRPNDSDLSAETVWVDSCCRTAASAKQMAAHRAETMEGPYFICRRTSYVKVVRPLEPVIGYLPQDTDLPIATRRPAGRMRDPGRAPALGDPPPS